MAYDVLKNIEAEDMLWDCRMAMSGKSPIKTVFGKDIVSVDRSKVTFTGGETGQEELEAPIDSIQEIMVGGKVVFTRKKKIDRIYPRGRR